MQICGKTIWSLIFLFFFINTKKFIRESKIVQILVNVFLLKIKLSQNILRNDSDHASDDEKKKKKKRKKDKKKKRDKKKKHRKTGTSDEDSDDDSSRERRKKKTYDDEEKKKLEKISDTSDMELDNDDSDHVRVC